MQCQSNEPFRAGNLLAVTALSDLHQMGTVLLVVPVRQLQARNYNLHVPNTFGPHSLSVFGTNVP